MKIFFRIFPLLLTVLVLSSCGSKKSELTVRNVSKENAGVSVVVCGKTFLMELGAGSQNVIRHKVECDSEYEVEAEFEKGDTIKKKVGYVTPQAAWFDLIELSPEDVTIKQLPQ